jgi:predicted membrane-bound dolichyl-phosphate-mannose-protein mannosyltransferase
MFRPFKFRLSTLLVVTTGFAVFAAAFRFDPQLFALMCVAMLPILVSAFVARRSFL